MVRSLEISLTELSLRLCDLVCFRRREVRKIIFLLLLPVRFVQSHTRERPKTKLQHNRFTTVRVAACNPDSIRVQKKGISAERVS